MSHGPRAANSGSSVVVSLASASPGLEPDVVDVLWTAEDVVAA